MKKNTAIAFFSAALWCTQAFAGDEVTYSSTNSAGTPVEVTAVLGVPEAITTEGGRHPAIILLHSKGGWEYPVTSQYAKALTEAGFIVLEPKLFANQASAPPIPPTLLPMVYDALQYLATRDDVDSKRIGVAGFSYGGALALHSAASWAQAKYAKTADLKFAAHAPFYPICWAFSAFAQGVRKVPTIPVDAFTKWTGAPVKIFAGGRDDYDDKDPNACTEFILSLPTDYQSSFSVMLYPEATHGWDQQSARFHESIACKGRGCYNTNEANPKITQQSINDLVTFFEKTLSPSHH